MPDRPDPVLFAPCGVNCLVCYAHVRSKKPCQGCLCGDEGKSDRCKRCAIKRLDKSYRIRYGTSLVENSRLAASRGLEAFMESEQMKWRCSCGGAVCVYGGACPECGKIPSGDTVQAE